MNHQATGRMNRNGSGVRRTFQGLTVTVLVVFLAFSMIPSFNVMSGTIIEWEPHPTIEEYKDIYAISSTESIEIKESSSSATRDIPTTNDNSRIKNSPRDADVLSPSIGNKIDGTGDIFESDGKRVDSSIKVHLNIRSWFQKREHYYSSWSEIIGSVREMKSNADKDGPILDFLVAGFPKTGTTTLVANLGHVAPVPARDICHGNLPKIVKNAYGNWPRIFGKDKPLTGFKCPQYMNRGDWLVDLSEKMPRTKLIVGIRHPILWFASFYSQMTNNWGKINPMDLTRPCSKEEKCQYGCPEGQRNCIYRGRFHLALASLGKTKMTNRERLILAMNDADGGNAVENYNISNSIFLYEQTTLNDDYVWEELAEYLNVAEIPHSRYASSHGKADKFKKRKEHQAEMKSGSSRNSKSTMTKNSTLVREDFCSDKYDKIRAKMMPIAYEVAVWMQDYFIPLARDESRTDVVIPKPDVMYDIVETYKKDPCGTLVRDENSGTYRKSNSTISGGIVGEG
uniref:Sulfotransferase domain-containing protein n=1 Tax=Chaetoceros debilis TaxID=122233 RepID=A0A7S3Q227_9STRA